MTYLGAKIINKFRSKTPRGFYDPIKGHTGIDYAMPIGTSLKLVNPVQVVDILTQKEMGLTLYVEDAERNIIVFAHLSQVLVKKDEYCSPGTLLAKSGNSGSATTGPHLHREVIAPKPMPGLEFMTRTLGRWRGWNIDPEIYDAMAGEQAIPLWAKESVEKAKKKGITNWTDPYEAVTPQLLEYILHDLGHVKEIQGNMTRVRLIKALDNAGLLG